jgi:hypothetical protein
MYELFSISEHGAIGLRWMRSSKRLSPATGLYYYPDRGEYFYDVGRSHDDWFHLSDRVQASARFTDVLPGWWLSTHHRRNVRAMLVRFHELVQQSPEALQAMSLHAYLKLLTMLGLES